MSGIINEYKDINTKPIGNCGIYVGLFDENNYRKWRASILGPKDTSYKGGLFYLSVTFPENYPELPPEVCFLTPIYHLNVKPYAANPKHPGSEPLGHVSLSTLNFWRPHYTIKEVLIHTFTLLYFNNPDSPYGLDRADEFRFNRQAFEEKVKLFTKKYAHPIKGKNLNPQDKDKDWDFSI